MVKDQCAALNTVCIGGLLAHLIEGLVQHRIGGLVNKVRTFAAVKHLSSQCGVTDDHHLQQFPAELINCIHEKVKCHI